MARRKTTPAQEVESQFQLEPEHPLTSNEIEGIIIAVRSAFLKLHNLYVEIEPIFNKYGLKAPSAGVIARNLSEEIETSIVQHCSHFARGEGFSDLQRFGARWEVKICKRHGLTINQSSTIKGENYIVVNYTDNNEVSKVWVLWEARDEFFSARRTNSNARAASVVTAAKNIQMLFKDGTASLALQLKPVASVIKKQDAASTASGSKPKSSRTTAPKKVPDAL